MEDKIKVKGARTHNLKNISLEIPRNKMIVFTGLSGSGKSSLAFDTIFAEGQRRYVESLSAYARQFLRQMQKPDIDEISGLSPAISIDQKSRSNNPRSTVATITEIYDYLRVLFARVGKPHCLVCGDEIQKLSNEEIINLTLLKIGKTTKKAKIIISAPVVRGRKGEHYQLLYDLLGKGFADVIVDGKRKQLREQIILTKTKKHDIEVVVDEFTKEETEPASSSDRDKKAFTERLSEDIERALEEAHGVVKVIIKEGKKKDEFLMSSSYTCPKDGFSFIEIEPRLFSFNSPYGACEACHGLGTKHFFGNEVCEECNGARLRKEALNVLIGGKNIVEVTGLTIKDGRTFFEKLKLTKKEKEISNVVTKEIEARLKFMFDVGLDYLGLNRKANTLSGGEAQRIRLASQLGSRLVGALYVLDEPTIGLHQKDNDRLIKTLKDLRELGNTILVVEHDEDTIFASDYLVDIGPGAGVHGGDIVVADYTEKLLTAKTPKNNSLTLKYLRGEEEVEIPEKRRNKNKGSLKVSGGKIHNIQNLNVEVPLGRMVTVTGMSGSGKSSFLYDILHRNLRARLDRKFRSNEVFNCKNFTGTEYAHRTILIDQSPIGRTPRSNPATYTGAWSHIRDLFATTEEARFRGWGPGRFSFNVKGGRCEACQGNGEVGVEMQFLPTVYVTCDVCMGKRFQKETLEVKYKHKNIYEVLTMTIEEGMTFFEEIPAIYDRLKTLNDVGLGYLELGQSATTLSGGEAQRVKISKELYRPFTEKTVYLLDEPTIGLHYEDVKNLLTILQKLIERGNTVVLIEHNMEIIKSSDYLIDLGPEGGVNGGKLVAKGTPEEVANNPKSITGKYLKKYLK
ncbi:excinuclease ABC subunit A [bacterium]|nr:excinuclease ABC subunit A [bacterium]|tara:strand:+ start:240 stop:2792 length:2553 start_codon:yes stop_codon:yes gene_type:complete